MKINFSPVPALPVPDRKRDLGFNPIDRWWFVTPEGQLVRGKSHENYEHCFYAHSDIGPRHWTMLLRPDDPSPIGRRLYVGKNCGWVTPGYLRAQARWYRENFQVGVWTEIVREAGVEIPPYRNCTALTVREERAS